MNKLLPPLAMPVVVGITFTLLGIVLRRRWVGLVGVAVLWIASTPLVGNAMLRWVEAGQVRTLEADAPSADMIVVLSDGRHLAPGPARVSEWGDADRFFGGLELWAAGKAPRLVFTDATPTPLHPNHGAILRRHAERFGVDAAAIDVAGPVATTEDEADVIACMVAARTSADAAGEAPTILLVTSAFHMPRAQSVFERRGFDVLPFPVDFRSSVDRPFRVMDLVPSSGALRGTELAWREMIGRWWERSMGRLRAPACQL